MRLMLLLLLSVAIKAHGDAVHINILTEEFPPYNYQQDGEIRGLSADVVRELVSRVPSASAEITMYPWLRAYGLASEEANTAIFSIGRNAEREDTFHWVGVIAPAQFYLFSNKDNPVTLTSLEQAKTLRVGTFPKTVREQYLLEKGFELEKNIVSIYDYERLFEMLRLQRIDLWAMNELLAYHIVRRKGFVPEQVLHKAYYFEELSPEGYYLAFNKKTDKALLDQYDQALKMMHHGGTYERILRRYLRP